MSEERKQRHAFTKKLLQDIEALEGMISQDLFEKGIKRIGAEQELVIVDKKTLKAQPIAPSIIEQKGDRDWLVPELSKFNLEINLPPYELKKNCFSELENLLRDQLTDVDQLLEKQGAYSVLTGVLPTLRIKDMEIENISPHERYKQLFDALNRHRMGSSYELRISGIDELLVKHDSPLLEACNTSFQVHLQVAAADFKKYYNHSLALTAPIIAVSSNSPLVFGKRLWHESRIALFQQAIDTRTTVSHMRERSPRVNLGSGFLEGDVVDIYKEDLSKFKILFYTDDTENSLEQLRKGKIPKLKSLALHNSTVYRWNRPCYGISPNGQPHLRIENRVIPSGPSLLDEVANAVFWVGCMEGFAANYKDIRKFMSFDDIRDNFSKSARMGIDSEFTWFKDKKITAKNLVLKELLPIAQEGLKMNKVDQADIDKYLGIIKDRTKAHMTGARWMLRGYTKLKNETTQDEALSVLTTSIIQNQDMPDNPVHKWKMPELKDLKEYMPLQLSVAEFMDTELYTVQADDSLELVAELMDYNNIRYAPVENEKGNLIGLVSARMILKNMVRKSLHGGKENICVEHLMIKNPISIEPSKSITEAIELMTKHQIGCLPVVKENELVGTITEKVFIQITSRLIDAME